MMPESVPPPTPAPLETELKFALPLIEPAVLLSRLRQVPALRRRQASVSGLHSVYYDTADGWLRQHQMALRLRRLGTGPDARWVQTLKIGAASPSALSQRGEWESTVPSAHLDYAALVPTPWPVLDPDGRIFAELQPCFTTTFERTAWMVRRRDGSAVEVALDIGQVLSQGKTAPICELEMEQVAGSADALFCLAREVAQVVPLLPLGMSKAERGYRVAQGSVYAPLRAQPVGNITAAMALPALAARVLGEMFGQWTANLIALRTADDPELVHQARIGWRRWRSFIKLLPKTCAVRTSLPACTALAPLLAALRVLRDTDVAQSDTLPPLALAYTGSDPLRQQHWQDLEHVLAQTAQTQRQTVRAALEQPAVGLALLELAHWLEMQLPALAASTAATADVSVTAWAKRRIARLRRRLQTLKASGPADLAQQHARRIVSKQLRYGIEALRPVLPKRRTKRWQRQALQMQTSIGTARDLAQMAELVARLPIAPELLGFLRGVAYGRGSMRSQ